MFIFLSINTSSSKNQSWYFNLKSCESLFKLTFIINILGFIKLLVSVVKTFDQLQQIFSLASLIFEFQQFLKTTMSSNLVEMILPSETFINILEYFSWFSFLVSTMLFLLMYWVVIKNSPKEMKV